MMSLPDPRNGDAEDDASSTKARSLLSLAGSLLAEISLPKLVLSWCLLIGLPGFILGLAPLAGSIWFSKVSANVPLLLTALSSLLIVPLLVVAAWFGGRPLLRVAESSFWSLHALGIQPFYAFGREALRHAAEKRIAKAREPGTLNRIRAFAALTSGVILSLAALWIAALAWPLTRWSATLQDLADPLQFLPAAAANAIFIVSVYFSVAALAWAVADARMSAPADIDGFAVVEGGAKRWRIAHLSDVHAVAGRYGFRIECGRLGPRGNDRLAQVLARLDAINADSPLDYVLVTGDMTDAGSATEWAAFLDMLEAWPLLAAKTLILPGNHDLNVVDRANPARLELPGSPLQRLRQMRTLSAMCRLQGRRTRVWDSRNHKPGLLLDEFASAHAEAFDRLANVASFQQAFSLSGVFDEAFPQFVPPDADGLGVILLNSNALTHFSFTNALGMLTAAELTAVEEITAYYPQARWIIGLHHHLVEYPRPAKELSERVGTALINGSAVVRRLKNISGRSVVMHGHRHTEWVGQCGGLTIVSAPSPVMGGMNGDETHFFIHTVAAPPDGGLALLQPEKVTLPAL